MLMFRANRYLMVMIMFALFAIVSACQADQEAVVSVKQVFSAAQCGSAGGTAASITQIANENGFRKLYGQLHSHLISQKPIEVPTHDFQHAWLVMISMGMRNTGGFAVNLAEEKAVVSDNIARVRLNWVMPPADALLTQAITNPCLIVSLERGNYRKIEFVDQDARLHGSLAVERTD